VTPAPTHPLSACLAKATKEDSAGRLINKMPLASGLSSFDGGHQPETVGVMREKRERRETGREGGSPVESFEKSASFLCTSLLNAPLAIFNVRETECIGDLRRSGVNNKRSNKPAENSMRLSSLACWRTRAGWRPSTRPPANMSAEHKRCSLTSSIAINSCFAIPSLSESQLSTTKMMASVFG
jgi:hypothetical protein